ncbi:toxin-antitoxin system toxin subunit [Nonomuraea sp. FMUSA5-5]|uniref:Toxin-antitoxin system toxin subunit n=1 Tax=Nonomuraea composti TaxID=2720023 RepID=A0ABX1B1C9_9ACTN|nr:SRPBCC domain-containing protein [Nonomuraea sp. FMUSA5-5]NJP91643.1 toxin-antitoxin system toxin subunit [Nonomuraea sp. FMUSA5-5]
MNETLTLHPDGRTTLTLQRRLPHPPEKVWRAITQPQHLAAWFPADVTINGDHITYGFGPHGHITHNDPPHTFAHTWGEDELRWHLTPDGTGTLLTLTHTFTDHHGAASFAAGWHTCLIALLAHLDQRPSPVPADPGPAHSARLHEDYHAILGLHSTTADGTTVRTERQLTRPAEHVWHLLGGPDATPGALPPAPFTIPGLRPGPVTRAESAKLLEYDTATGSVRWELTAGTGQGPRLIITCTGAPGTADAWRIRAEELAASLIA